MLQITLDQLARRILAQIPRVRRVQEQPPVLAARADYAALALHLHPAQRLSCVLNQSRTIEQVRARRHITLDAVLAHG